MDDRLGVGANGTILIADSVQATGNKWTTTTYPNTTAQGDVIYASSANTIAGLTKDTNATRYLSNTGASNNPAWAQVALATGVSGVLPEANGGTNQSTYAAGDILYASAANTLSKLAISTYPGSPLQSDGSLPVYFSPLQYVYMVDDFISNTNNTSYSIFAWDRIAAVGGGINTNPAAVTGHPGMAQPFIGTSAGSGGGITCGISAILFGDGLTRLDFVMQVPVLSDATDEFRLRVGFGDNTSTGAFTDGAYFEYIHGTNSGNWQILTANNSSRTTANTNSTVDTNWHRYTIIGNAGGTSISFYIDGSEVVNSPIAADIPTGAGRNFGFDFQITRVSGSSNNRVINIDLVTFYKKLTSTR